MILFKALTLCLAMQGTTTTISGPTNIDDTVVRNGTPTTNYGSSGFIVVDRSGGGTIDNGLMRPIDSALPSGVASALRVILYHNGVRNDLAIAKVLTANNWTEGGATWNTTDGSTSWAGSAGCETANTDYDDTTKIPYTSTASSLQTVTLDADWAQAWMDDADDNEGILIFYTAQASNVIIEPTDDADSDKWPYFEIDWDEAVAAANLQPQMMFE